MYFLTGSPVFWCNECEIKVSKCWSGTRTRGGWEVPVRVLQLRQMITSLVCPSCRNELPALLHPDVVVPDLKEEIEIGHLVFLNFWSTNRTLDCFQIKKQIVPTFRDDWVNQGSVRWWVGAAGSCWTFYKNIQFYSGLWTSGWSLFETGSLCLVQTRLFILKSAAVLRWTPTSFKGCFIITRNSQWFMSDSWFRSNEATQLFES